MAKDNRNQKRNKQTNKQTKNGQHNIPKDFWKDHQTIQVYIEPMQHDITMLAYLLLPIHRIVRQLIHLTNAHNTNSPPNNGLSKRNKIIETEKKLSMN